MQRGQFPIGTIIAERRVKLYDKAGEERSITVRLGSPVGTLLVGDRLLGPDDSENPTLFRCPFQIKGLDHDDKVYAPASEDPFVALQYALDFIGDLLRDGSRRLDLENRRRSDPARRDYWIWQYPA